MRVFVTGATGFIGSAVVPELIQSGHQVLGLARSDSGAKWLTSVGAEVQRGELQDLDSLRNGASRADAVIHLAFIHDFANFQENCEIDRRAIQAIGAELAGSPRLFIVTGGVAGIAAPGKLATEDMDVPAAFPMPRVSEQTALALPDVNASVVRLSQIHNTRKQGLITYLVALAREKGVSAYIGEGHNRWAAAHISDTGRLYKLVLDNHEAGAKYHAVAEEGVPMLDIANAIGRSLKVPVKSIPAAEAESHFGWLARFAASDLQGSSVKTRQKLGWNPTGPGLIADLDRLDT